MQATSADLGLMVLPYNLKRWFNLGVFKALDCVIAYVLMLIKAFRKRMR